MRINERNYDVNTLGFTSIIVDPEEFMSKEHP